MKQLFQLGLSYYNNDDQIMNDDEKASLISNINNCIGLLPNKVSTFSPHFIFINCHFHIFVMRTQFFL